MTTAKKPLPGERKRRSKTSPTQRSLQHERRLGRVAAIVEKWNPHAKVRQDLFGWIDILSVDQSSKGVIGIQTTSASNAAKRIQKARKLGSLIAWLTAGNRLVVHAWAKRGARGAPGERKVWTVKETEVRLPDLLQRDATSHDALHAMRETTA